MRARAFEARMKKSINEKEEEISRTRRVALELRVCAYIGYIERELTDLCGQQTAKRPAVNPSLWGVYLHINRTLSLCFIVFYVK